MVVVAMWFAGAGAAFGQNDAPDPYELLAAAIDHSRSETSYSELRMLIHRPPMAAHAFPSSPGRGGFRTR